MKKNLQSPFQSRQYMVSTDYELYYYNDSNMKPVASHCHDYYEFYFFLEGDVDIQLEETNYAVHPGDLFIIPPGLFHKPVINNSAIPYRRFVFWVSCNFLSDLGSISSDYQYLAARAEGKACLHTMDQITANALQNKMLDLIEELHDNRFGKQAQCLLYVQELVLFINRMIYNANEAKQESSEQKFSHILTSYIEKHLDEPLSLGQLANTFFLSKYYISHLFKEQLGLSVHQYITKKRLQRCREAIRSGCGITQVYNSFGFGDYSSFYRAFKKEYGISPKEYQLQQSPKLK